MAVQQFGICMDYIIGVIVFIMIAYGGPVTDVIPIKIRIGNQNFLCMFHNGIIE